VRLLRGEGLGGGMGRESVIVRDANVAALQDFWFGFVLSTFGVALVAAPPRNGVNVAALLGVLDALRDAAPGGRGNCNLARTGAVDGVDIAVRWDTLLSCRSRCARVSISQTH
jgi:hypothetical protein